MTEIEIAIVDNDIYEEDEQFLVRLSQVRAHSPSQFTPIPVRLGAASTATVLIVDDDHAGAFGFASEKFKVVESAGEFVAEIIRTRGARGEVSIPYKTVDGQAKAGADYEHQEGMIRFEDEQIKAEIHIPIVNDDEYEKSEEFFIELGEPVWHREIEDGEEGLEGRPVLSLSRCKVVITEDKEFKNFVDRMLTNANTSIMVGTSSWKQQFNEAITIEEDEDGNITLKEKIMHYVSLPWKVLFALIPPTDYYNGWLCFFFAIVMIGLLTAVIGDLASHFGCTVGMKDAVTAISLVAMGTSTHLRRRRRPYRTAGLTALLAMSTGSNAVNVFLGIGIAWAIAACVHAWNGTRFMVQTGSLAFSVTMFIIGSVICIAVLQYRRFSKTIAGELGGPVRLKYISSAVFVLVWIAYLTLSTLEAYCIIPGF
ncbi:Calx-beta domain protein [Ostertagia ostertagi]